ncbi:hillarin-like [Limulus polyphemus]|uniref:Hillarin-like n=1 Tax=Limulus polyphemus TaxID=6850 RepID=A0ABM1B232_LIMPO|nr:hillarin-like [Limulus polyphemus]
METVNDSGVSTMVSDHSDSLVIRPSDHQVPPDNRMLTHSNICFRCQDPVYPTEKIQPNQTTSYHMRCFKCKICDLKLALQTFFTNQRNSNDGNVYCRAHVPKLAPGVVDNLALSISVPRNLSRNHQATNLQVRGPEAGKGARYDNDALCIQTALRAPRVWEKPREMFHTENVAKDIVKSDVIGLKYF